MYSISTDTYTCDFCDTEMKWDKRDDIWGTMWSCEKCGNNFCTKCFTERHGLNKYREMMQGHDLIFCPTCYGKRNDEYDR